MAPSTWSLILQARIWRCLARIGFWLHTFPKPSPSPSSFIRRFTAKSLDGTRPASLELAFYVPPDYDRQIQRGKRYPVVVNFHGGGFTMGRTSDDARWATMVAREVSAVVVGVAYRLAPEHPFPTAVEDGVCALLHLSANAETLGINASKMTLSGFSAGGNLAFTVPLRLEAHLRAQEKKIKEEEEEGEEGYKEHDPLVPALLPRIVSIIAWYPNVDARLPRAHRIATSPEPTKTLPSLLTSLFDASYFPLPSNTTSPYASPAAATDEALTAALPDHVALYLCEWDMLLREGQEFGERLKGLGKRVRCQVIKERRHGFDKSPWPFGLDWKVMACYTQACRWLCEVNECATFYTPG